MELEPLAKARAWRTMPLEGDAEDAEDSVGAVSHDWRCSANTPRSVDVGSRDGEAVSEVEEELRRQAFGEHIRKLSRAGNMRDAELANGYLFPDEVNVQFNVLGASMVDGVLGHVYRGNIVTERHRS
jgi:hypothetical protein